MNEDVRKAVERAELHDYELSFDGMDQHKADWHTIRQALRDQEAEIATLREAMREMILVHVVDDDAWDQAAETEQRMQRAIGAARSRITATLEPPMTTPDLIAELAEVV